MRAAELLARRDLPASEARALLAHVLAVPRERLLAHPDTEIGAPAAQRFAELARRRLAGEPLAYLLGVKEFYGRPFRVTPAVLVPRPETETLVDAALSRLRAMPASRVLELGTGSGCIAITLALECPQAAVTATDLSAEALEVAAGNAAALGASVAWLRSDWLQDVDPRARFDLILSNPPYIAHGDPHLADLRHEPDLALTAADNGLACLAAIVRAGAPRLAAGGWLALEHGHDQAEAVRRLLLDAGLAEVSSRTDGAGIERVALGRA